MLQLFIKFISINSGVYLFLNSFRKFRVEHKITNDIFDSCVDSIFAPLFFVVTQMIANFYPMFVAIIIVISIIATVGFSLPVNITIHSCSTYRTFQNTGKNVFVVETINLFPFLTGL